MSRSRSSFDLSGAIATAASLSVVVPEEQPPRYRGVPLVSFGPTAAGPATELPPERRADHRGPAGRIDGPGRAAALSAPGGSGQPSPNPPGRRPPPRQASSHAAEPAEVEPGAGGDRPPPPKLPDLSEIEEPDPRAARRSSSGSSRRWRVTEVFIADAAGLPIAGAIARRRGAPRAPPAWSPRRWRTWPRRSPATARRSSRCTWARARSSSSSASRWRSQSYVVGFHRPTPLGFRQAHAVRLACRHALSLGGDGETPRSCAQSVDSDGGSPPPHAAEHGSET